MLTKWFFHTSKAFAELPYLLRRSIIDLNPQQKNALHDVCNAGFSGNGEPWA